MRPRLSPKTEQYVALLFPQDSRDEAAEILLNQCGNNLPLHQKSSEFQLERVRFAALKLSGGELARLQDAVKLAQQDWRDLLVAAGFGEADAHTRWSPVPFEKG